MPPTREKREPAESNVVIEVLAADPGESTGLAWLPAGGTIETTVTPDAETTYRAIYTLRPKVIVVEWFVTGQRLNQYSRLTIERCGGIEAVALVIGAKLIKYRPRDRERYLDAAEAMLVSQHGERGSQVKGHGVWTDHQLDALAGLMFYLANSGVPRS